MIDFKLVVECAIILVILGRIVMRQLQWRVLDPRKNVRLPVILGVIGVIQIASAHGVALMRVTTFMVILAEVVVSLGIGAAMGAVAQFRPSRNASERNAGTWETRTGWLGTVLWIAAIGVRVVGHLVLRSELRSEHLPAAIGVGLVLVMLAANRAGRLGMLTRRARARDGIAAS